MRYPQDAIAVGRYRNGLRLERKDLSVTVESKFCNRQHP